MRQQIEGAGVMAVASPLLLLLMSQDTQMTLPLLYALPAAMSAAMMPAVIAVQTVGRAQSAWKRIKT